MEGLGVRDGQFASPPYSAGPEDEHALMALEGYEPSSDTTYFMGDLPSFGDVGVGGYDAEAASLTAAASRQKPAHMAAGAKQPKRPVQHTLLGTFNVHNPLLWLMVLFLLYFASLSVQVHARVKA